MYCKSGDGSRFGSHAGLVIFGRSRCWFSFDMFQFGFVRTGCALEMMSLGLVINTSGNADI